MVADDALMIAMKRSGQNGTVVNSGSSVAVGDHPKPVGISGFTDHGSITFAITFRRHNPSAVRLLLLGPLFIPLDLCSSPVQLFNLVIGRRCKASPARPTFLVNILWVA
jgi:hypothetical protein